MNSPRSQEIVKRFLQAIEILIQEGVYESWYDYIQQNGFKQGPLYRVKRDPITFRPEVEWFEPLFIKHDIDKTWFFTGAGKPFKKLKR